MNMRNVLLPAIVLVLSSCAVTDSQVRSAVKKNPQIVFDAIESDPEAFMASVNRAAEKAQRARSDREYASLKEAEQKDIEHPRQPKLEAGRRLIGSESGKIVIVEYADFQCPACGMAHGFVKEFMSRHPGEVQFYFKNMPLDFHHMAMPAATYFEALRHQDPTKAARFYDYVFENQREMQSESFLKAAITKVGADLKHVEKDLQSAEVRSTIDADQDEFKSFGFTGTPVLIVNGVAMVGAQPVAELERVVAQTKK